MITKKKKTTEKKWVLLGESGVTRPRPDGGVTKRRLLPKAWIYALSNHVETFPQFCLFQDDNACNFFRNHERLGTKPKLRSLVQCLKPEQGDKAE